VPPSSARSVTDRERSDGGQVAAERQSGELTRRWPGDAYARHMSAQAPAGARFLVRAGALTFAERVLESLAMVGYDAFGIVALGAPGFIGPRGVLEIVDRHSDRVVWRTHDEFEALEVLHDLITQDLRELEVATFAATWDLR
jgi:hypothetical protein